jgi:intein/homing endonuclease
VGKCLVQGQDILLASGHYLPIQWFVDQDINVITFDNAGIQKSSSAHVFDNGLRDCVEVTSRTGRVLRCTKNHPLLTTRGWKEVQNLKPGDKIAVPLHITAITPTVTLNENELKILAYLIGDGCITSSTPRFTQRDNAQCTEFKQLAEYLGDKITAVNKRSAATDYRVVGKNVRRILTEHFYTNENSHEKSLPLMLFGADNTQVAVFLSRLFSTDGSIEKRISRGKERAVISYCSCNKHLVRDVQRLLLRFKISSYIRFKSTVNAYELVITDFRSLLSFLTNIGIYGRDEDLKYVAYYLSTVNQTKINTSPLDTFDLHVSQYILTQLKLQHKSQTVNGIRHRVWADKCLTRDTVKFYASYLNDAYLKFITTDWFGWDEIETITDLGLQQTYGVTVPITECYVTDYIEHNTALLARLMIHFLHTRPFPVIPCTAPTQKQLFNVLWAEAGRAMSKSSIVQSLFEWQQERIFLKGYKDRWFAVAIVSTPPKPGAMTTESLQGYHGEHLLFLIDECSGIADQILGAADGAMSTPSARAILASNPTRNTGYFHRAANSPDLADLWARIFVDAEQVDSEYIDKTYIQRLKKIYGENSDYFRMRVRGLPPRSETNALVSPEQVFDAHRRTSAERSNYIIGSCDPARFGDDDSVMYIRDGNVILKRYSIHGMDVVQLGNLCLQLIIDHNCDEFRVDSIGVGGGVVDYIKHNIASRHHKCSVISVHVGEDAIYNSEFVNKRAEVAWQIRRKIDEIYIPFETPLLDEELTVTRYGWDSKDKRIKLESKDDIKKNLNPRRSPNDLDALCLNCAELNISAEVDKMYFLIGSKDYIHNNRNANLDSESRYLNTLLTNVNLDSNENINPNVNDVNKTTNIIDLADFLSQRSLRSSGGRIDVGVNRFSVFKKDFSDFNRF